MEILDKLLHNMEECNQNIEKHDILRYYDSINCYIIWKKVTRISEYLKVIDI